MADILSARAGLVTFGATVVKPGGGTFTSYDLKAFFDASPATIPCFIAVLDLEQQPGWQSLAFQGSGQTIEFSLIHYCLWKAVANNEDFTYIEPDLWQIVVNYNAALAATPFLTASSAPAIHYAPKVQWSITRSKWGEVQYHGPIFRLDCKLNL